MSAEGLRTAWVSDGARIYLAQAAPAARAPYSPVTELIQGVYRLHRDQARRILRARIYTDHPPTPMCRATVKVAAKRVTHDPTARPPAHLPRTDVTAWPRYEAPDVAELIRLLRGEHDPLPEPAAFMRLARRLAEPTCSSEDAVGTGKVADAVPAAARTPRHARDRPVGAVLVSRFGQLLAGARNAGSMSRALHAEVNLVQSWFRATGQPLPVGSRIYVSLKPCRMCAAMIWHAAEDVRSLTVYYGEDDPGPNARATTLDCHSYDRVRAAGGDPALAAQELQFRLS